MGHEPREALKLGYRRALWSLTAMINERPEALFGVVAASMVEGVGTPFFLGTDEIYRHGRSMLTKGQDVIALMSRTFQTLENLVSSDNDRAIRLLRRWGFDVGGEVRDFSGVDFVPFRMTI